MAVAGFKRRLVERAGDKFQLRIEFFYNEELSRGEIMR